LAAMDHSSWEMSYYLDTETGESVLVTSETRSQLDELSAQIPHNESDQADFDWDSAINQLDIPDWQKQALRLAVAVEEGFGERYLAIPLLDSNEAFNDMAYFVETVQNPNIRRRLAQALNLNHPFRRFKEVLYYYPAEKQQWYKFQDERQLERCLDWLTGEGIEPLP